ncbi:MAG TPA: response regulator, partial [Gemmatimonadales bacterium]|nr:response regulator [Gemmatimonadales bacterium]
MDRGTGRPRANPLIAVVDDDEEVRRALGRLLRSAGFAVLPFETAEQFLANDPGHTDCLVADVCLPGMSGTDLEDHLARSEPSLPVVLITALDDAGTTERLKRSRAITVLQKPFAD